MLTERYLGEIAIFAGNYAPVSWSYCVGSKLAIVGNEALFSLLGTIYGGDGRSSFGIPDMRSRVPVGWGSGPGLTPRNLGQLYGVETVTLNASQIPSHTHQLMVSGENATHANPKNYSLAKADQFAPANIEGKTVPMRSDAIANSGQSEPHFNVAPVLALNFIICMAGVYPTRS